MTLLPASAELAANAGTGPEGHKRSASVDSGASSDATMVACDIDGIDVADLGAIDGRHKTVATGKLPSSPPEPLHQRAASNKDLAAHDAQRGRVSTDTASGAPALATTTTNEAGSPTAAAPMTVSIYTATALAVADPNADTPNEPNEASDAGGHEAAPAHSAPATVARDAAAAATASSAAPDVVIAPSTPAPASSAIVDHNDLAPASASSSTGTASGLGAAASKSDTIVAGAVPIRAFSIGRTSTPAPAPGALLAALLASATALHGPGAIACLAAVNHSGLASPAPAADAEKLNTLDVGSKSAVIVANATSRVHANCPSTPVVSRQAAPRPHAIAGAAVNAGQYSAFYIGRKSIAWSTAVPAVPPTPATTAADLPAPALPPMLATALSPMQSQSSPARFGLLRTVSRVIQRGMGAIRDALIAMYTDGIGPTNAGGSTSPGLPDEDGCWDEGAPIGAALLELRRRERRRFL